MIGIDGLVSPLNMAARVLPLAKQGKSSWEIAEETGLKLKSIRVVISGLRARGELERARPDTKPHRKNAVMADQIKPLLERGFGAAEIASQIGRSINSVKSCIKRLRAEAGGSLPARKRAPTLRERILPLALEGKESASIADALGLPVSSVHRTISELRASGALPPVEPSRVPDDVLPLVRQGLNGAQIARRLGVSRDVVYKAVRALRNTGQLAPRNKAAVGTGRVPEPPSLASLPPRSQPLLFARFASTCEREARTDGLIDLLDLSDKTCRWPVGDPTLPGFGFCGDEVSPGCKPYCATHGLRAYAPSAERKAIDRLLNIPKAKRVAA